MIPFERVRQAERQRLEAYIAAQPSQARFRTGVLSVRMSEPMKTRELRLGGLQPDVEVEIIIVLPLGAPAPNPEKERIDIVDLAGDYRTYDLRAVTVLRGLGCFRIGLRRRNNAPTTTPPPRPA